MKKTYVIREKQTGSIFETGLSMEWAEMLVRNFEESDKRNGVYTPDFYEIAPSEGISEDINPYPKYPINGQVEGFTGGEWKISGTTRGLNGLYVGTDKQHIAQVFSSIPECEANARLIAAAPDMYYALKEITEMDESKKTEEWNIGAAKKKANELKAILNRINKQ